MRRFVLLSSLLVAMTVPSIASAKGVEHEQLFTATLSDMPPAPTPSALARITFAPGSGLSMTANLGPALHYVEEGSFDVLMLGSGALERAGATTPEQATPVASGEQFTINPGDLLVIPANTPFEVFNNGTTPSEALIIEFFTRDLDAPLPDGIALDILVAGQASSLDVRKATVTLARVSMEPGTHMSFGTAGVDFIYVERGTAAYSFAPAEPTPAAADLSFPAGSTAITQIGRDDMIQSIGAELLSLLVLTLNPASAQT